MEITLPVVAPLHPLGWIRPAGNLDYRITSPFGKRTYEDANGVEHTDFHSGIDIGNTRLGGRVFPIADGEIIAVGKLGAPYSELTTEFDSGNYGGIMMVIRHSPRVRSVYAHLSTTYNFTVGMRVGPKTVIGAIGDTGSAKGMGHLHLEIIDDEANTYPTNLYYKNRVDPTPYLFHTKSFEDNEMLTLGFGAYDILANKRGYVKAKCWVHSLDNDDVSSRVWLTDKDYICYPTIRVKDGDAVNGSQIWYGYWLYVPGHGRTFVFSHESTMRDIETYETVVSDGATLDAKNDILQSIITAAEKGIAIG